MDQPYVYDKNFKRHVPVEFAQDGEICRYYIFKEDLPNKGAGLMSIIHDLTECETAIKTLQEIMHDKSVATVIKSSLYTSSVSLYSRCFNEAWGRNAGLKDSIFDTSDDEMKKFHATLKTMRNAFIGHAGKSPHESISLILYFHPNTEEVITSKGSVNKHQFAHDLDTFLRLIDYARKIADNMFTELKPELENFIKSQDMRRLFKRAKIPKPQDFI